MWQPEEAILLLPKCANLPSRADGYLAEAIMSFQVWNVWYKQKGPSLNDISLPVPLFDWNKS